MASYEAPQGDGVDPAHSCRFSAVNSGIELHARIHRFTQGPKSPRGGGGGADGAYNQAWLAVRGATSEIVHDVTVPLLRWCDRVAPPARVTALKLTPAASHSCPPASS